MEVASPQQLHLGDSFSREWLRCAQALEGGSLAGRSFGSSRSFIDMDPAELFSMRWTPPATTAATATPSTDFEFFGLPGSGGHTSPMLVSATQIFRSGGLLPCELGGCAGAQEDGDVGDPAGRLLDVLRAPLSPATSPWLFLSAQSTPSSSVRPSGAGNRKLAGRRGGWTSPWKVLLRHLRFLLPLYRKFRALRPPSHRVSPAAAAAAASLARGSTASIECWCHGDNADAAVDDAILYCKKSSASTLWGNRTSTSRASPFPLLP